MVGSSPSVCAHGDEVATRGVDMRSGPGPPPGDPTGSADRLRPDGRRLDLAGSAGPRPRPRPPAGSRRVSDGAGDRCCSSGPGRRGAGAAEWWPDAVHHVRGQSAGEGGTGSARAWGSLLRCAGQWGRREESAAPIRIHGLPQTRRVDDVHPLRRRAGRAATRRRRRLAFGQSLAPGRRGPVHLAGRRRSHLVRVSTDRPADDLTVRSHSGESWRRDGGSESRGAAVEEVVAMDDEQQLVWRASPSSEAPRPWRSSIMPSAAPSGPRASWNRASTCCSRDSDSRVPPDAARIAPISWEISSRRCTSSISCASHASISLRSSPIRADGSATRASGRRERHSSGVSSVLDRRTPGTEKRPGALRARGVCCGGCSASGDGHRIPVTVVKADRGEHGPSLPQASTVDTTAPDGAPTRRDATAAVIAAARPRSCAWWRSAAGEGLGTGGAGFPARRKRHPSGLQ